MAVVGVDRWELAVLFDLRTDRGTPGSLLVVGDRERGISMAESRIGRFRNPDDEDAILRALQRQLARLAKQPRLGEER